MLYSKDHIFVGTPHDGLQERVWVRFGMNEKSEPLTPHAFAIAVVFHKRNDAKQMHYCGAPSPYGRGVIIIPFSFGEKVAFAF